MEPEELKEKSDRDLLIGLTVDMKWIIKGFQNHLTHHRIYTIAFITIIGGAIIALFLK